MNTDENNQDVSVDTQNNIGEGDNVDTISVPKADYDTMNQTLGSLKRELKDLKKAKESTEDTSKTTKPDDNRLLERVEKLALNTAGITHEDDVALAKSTAKKWNMDLEDVLVDDDFKTKLERQRTTRSNVVATTGIKGSAGTSQAKNTPEYWIAKGIPPSREDVPDRKVRAEIARKFMANAKTGKKFYND